MEQHNPQTVRSVAHTAPLTTHPSKLEKHFFYLDRSQPLYPYVTLQAPSAPITLLPSLPPFPFPSQHTPNPIPPTMQPPVSFLNPLNTTPLSPQILLPQTHLIIPPTHSQHIPAQTPTHPPQRGLEIQRRALPFIRSRWRGCPYPDGLVLRAGGDVGFGEQGGRPGYVSDPVGVAG